jgi:2-amino-4-hydroxy-6-hydroxymethyldihydropteridine diphosphokinase
MLARALACLGAQGDMVVGRRSSMYACGPWGYEDQEEFVNAVCEVDTHLGPGELLERLKTLEKCLGREPSFRWGPRKIDLDILFYGDMVLEERFLKVPHPLVCERLFVLAPLAEIAPDLVHPRTGLRILEHLNEIESHGEEVKCQSLDI